MTVRLPLIERLKASDDDEGIDFVSIGAEANAFVKDMVRRVAGPDQEYFVLFGVGMRTVMTLSSMAPDELVELLKAMSDHLKQNKHHLTPKPSMN